MTLRLRLLLVGVLVLASGFAVLFRAVTRPVPDAPIPPPSTSRWSRVLAPDLTLHAFRTGWVSVKTAHRTLAGPVALRMPSIVLDDAWTEWMPIYGYVVAHPDGLFLVDPGLTEAARDPATFQCDPGSAWVYAHLLRLDLHPEERVDRQLTSLALDPARLRGVVITHRHADHELALPLLPREVPVYVGAADWPSHAGALPCRWPTDRTPRLVRADEGPAAGVFPHSTPLTADGRVAIVPMTGHSPGHLGLRVRGVDRDVWLVGDATFSIGQVETRTLAGIVEQPEEAGITLDRLHAEWTARPSVMLSAHDPVALERWLSGAFTTPSPRPGPQR